MSATGKHSSLRFMACTSAGIVLVAGLIIMLLAEYFELSTGWLASVQDWLLLTTSMPNWSLLMIIGVSTSLLSIAIYQARRAFDANAQPHKLERKANKIKKLQALELTDNQTLLMETLAYHEHCKKIANLQSVSKLVSLSAQEVELGLKQLQARRLINQNVTRGTFGSTTFELTAAGRDFALERLKLS